MPWKAPTGNCAAWPVVGGAAEWICVLPSGAESVDKAWMSGGCQTKSVMCRWMAGCTKENAPRAGKGMIGRCERHEGRNDTKNVKVVKDRTVGNGSKAMGDGTSRKWLKG